MVTWAAWLVTGGFVTVVALYAGLSTRWVAADPGWYAALRRPWFQPPDLVFAVIWPLNFLALLGVGVSVGVTQSADAAARALAVLAVSVGFALGWAYLFYVPHRLVAAAVLLTLAASGTWWFVVLLGHLGLGFALVTLPYSVWLSVAAALSVGYARRN